MTTRDILKRLGKIEEALGEGLGNAVHVVYEQPGETDEAVMTRYEGLVPLQAGTVIVLRDLGVGGLPGPECVRDGSGRDAFGPLN